MQQGRIIRWYVLLACLVVIFTGYIAFTFDNTDRAAYHWKDVKQFNDGWLEIDSHGDERSTSIPLHDKVVAQKTYSIINRLPDTIVEGSVLCYRSNHLLSNIYINGQLAYKQEVDERSTIGKSPGFSYVFVPIASEDAGKVIKIDYTAVYGKSSFHINNFIIGLKTTIITELVRNKIGAAILCTTLFLLGILFIICYFIRRKIYAMKSSLLYLGMFLIPFSIWSILETQIVQFLFSNVYALQYVTYLSLGLATIPFLLYFSERHGVINNKAVKVISYYSFLTITLCLVLQAFGIADLPETVVILHSAVIFVLLYVLYYTIREFIEGKRNKLFSLQNFNMIVLTIGAFLDILRFYLIPNGDYSKYMRIAILIYLCGTGLDTMYKTAELTKKNQALERLVYVDEETTLYNKAAFVRQLEKVEHNNRKSPFILVEFEIMYLSELEQDAGLAAAHEIEKSTAKILQRAFHNTDMIFYVGNGKFIVYIEKDLDETYTTGMAVLKKRVHNSNKSRGQKLILANGYVKEEMTEQKTIDLILTELEDSLQEDKSKK